MVAAVIWDFGGVITSSPFEAFNHFEAERGLPRDFIRKVNSTNPHDNAWALFERNEIDTATFDVKFPEEATALGHPVRGGDILPRLSGDVRPRMVVAALKACKEVFKAGSASPTTSRPATAPAWRAPATRPPRWPGSWSCSTP